MRVPRKKVVSYERKMYALLDEKQDNTLVVAECKSDDEEFVQIHTSRRRAHAAAFNGERVVECWVRWSVKR